MTETSLPKPIKPLRILAVCSGGGHWVQMQRLRPAFDGHHVIYATVAATVDVRSDSRRIYRIPDANRDTKLRLALLLARLAWLVLLHRPHVVVTTGAAPGYFAIRLGRLLGAKTLFIDSIANAERLSLSARIAQPHAHVTLTQWEHLSTEAGPRYWGKTL